MVGALTVRRLDDLVIDDDGIIRPQWSVLLDLACVWLGILMFAWLGWAVLRGPK
jgi:hypothetical protein